MHIAHRACRWLQAVQTSNLWRTPMTSFATLAWLPVGLLVGLSSGCVHRSSTSPLSPPPPPAPPPSPPGPAGGIPPAPHRAVDQQMMGRFPAAVGMRTARGGLSVRLPRVSAFYTSYEP